MYIYPLFKPRTVINEVPSTRLLLEMAVLQETAVHTMLIVFTPSPSTVSIKMDPVPSTQKNVLESWPPRTAMSKAEEL